MKRIDYSEKIPNNVDLASDTHAAARARALAARLPRLVGRHGARGHAATSTSTCAPRSASTRGLGALRLREDARLPLGHLPRARRGRTARSTSATTRASPRGRTCPASTARTCAASSSPRATPSRRRSSSSAISASPPVALRPAQPVPGQRRGRPPPVGDGVPAARATSAATGARRPRRCSSAARATPTTRASSARSTSRRRLAGVLHVHVLHRPRRQVPALRAGRVGLRSARAHDAVHADRGGAPHVRRRVRRRRASSSAPAR